MVNINCHQESTDESFKKNRSIVENFQPYSPKGNSHCAASQMEVFQQPKGHFT